MKSPVIRFVYTCALAIAVAYAFHEMRGPHGISAWTRKRQEIRELHAGRRDHQTASTAPATPGRATRLTGGR